MCVSDQQNITTTSVARPVGGAELSGKRPDRAHIHKTASVKRFFLGWYCETVSVNLVVKHFGIGRSDWLNGRLFAELSSGYAYVNE